MAHKNKRRSRYEQIAKPEAVWLDDVREASRSGIARGVDEHGKPYLRLSWPGAPAKGDEQIIDVSEWLDYPRIAEPFALALLELGKKFSPYSRHGYYRELSCGFFDFLRESRMPNDIQLGSITTDVINGFIVWLSRTEGKAPKLAPATRGHRLSVVRIVIRHLRKTKWVGEISPKLRVRFNPWPGHSRQTVPIEVHSRPVWEALYRTCAKEAFDTMERIRNGWSVIQNEKKNPPPVTASKSDYLELGRCLAAVDALFADAILSHEAIYHHNRALWYAIAQHHGGLRGVVQYLYPLPRLLVPFVLIIAMHSLYNADGLLGMARGEVSRVSVLGVQRIRFRADKSRARRKQPRSFPIGNPLGPDAIVDFLEAWTARIRRLVPLHHRDRLFLFAPATQGGPGVSNGEGKGPRGFITLREEARRDTAWVANLGIFCAEHGLPSFNLAQVRKTGLDVVHDLFDGDLRAIQAASGHRDPQTFVDHYASDAARKRNDERLSGIIATRERWVASSGRIDPRSEPHQRDLGAATPGFGCLDPYDSPIPGERSGRLCRAYGACAGCALAFVDRTDPYALARLLQLKQKIEEAQRSIESRRWLAAWASKLKKLNEYWLPQFSDTEVIQEAALFHPPPLPDLE